MTDFGEIVQWLEVEVLPSMKKVTVEIEHSFKDVSVEFRVNHSETSGPIYLYQYYYGIAIACRLREVAEIEFNTVRFSVGITQRDDSSHPRIYAYVGWLVDEEPVGDFGLEMVNNLFPERQIANSDILDELKRSLPRLRQDFIKEVDDISKNQLP